MSVTYEDNNNKEFTNSSHVEGRRKPTATVLNHEDVNKLVSGRLKENSALGRSERKTGRTFGPCHSKSNNC